jgi:hypothetical protein
MKRIVCVAQGHACLWDCGAVGSVSEAKAIFYLFFIIFFDESGRMVV